MNWSKLLTETDLLQWLSEIVGYLKYFIKICKDIVLGGESSLLETIRTNENAFELEI
jgi:hypothetical protein